MEHSFSISKKGYLPSEVDRYIERLELELHDYKSKETAISKSIIHSEMASQEIINDAHKEAEIIREKAEDQLKELQKKIKHMRMKLDTFQSSYNQLMHKYIITMNSNDFNDLYQSLDNISDALTLNPKQKAQEETERSTPNNMSNLIDINYEKVSDNR